MKLYYGVADLVRVPSENAASEHRYWWTKMIGEHLVVVIDWRFGSRLLLRLIKQEMHHAVIPIVNKEE